MVKIKNLLHVFIIFSDIQNIGIDTLYVILYCRVTELLPEMDQERRPFCLCKLDSQNKQYFACLYHILWPSKYRYRHFIWHFCVPGYRVITRNGPGKAAILFMQIRCSTKYILHVFIIFSDLQNIGIDTLYVIFACLVTELLQEMNQERRPFCLCKLDGQKLKISFGNRVYRIQHTRIMLKSLVPNFYPKMPLEITFFQNPTRL